LPDHFTERFAGKELTTPKERRDAALKALRDHNISQRRVCGLVGVDPKTVRRGRPPDNPEIREEMKKIARKRRRFGYRRIGVLLEREGMIMNHKKLYRLYTDEKLSVRRRRARKRARGSRTPMPVALRPNERWSLDFVSDTFGASRKFRILAVNDDCCRENLYLMADTSISGITTRLFGHQARTQFLYGTSCLWKSSYSQTVIHHCRANNP
jgi:putative transposase